MDIYFSNCTAEPIVVDKTPFLLGAFTSSGTLKEPSSITNFNVTIKRSSFPSVNYAYIPVFRRYYYVTNITVVDANLYEISLSVDVLMSFKTGILKLEGFINRNEKTFNPQIVDKKRIILQGYDVEMQTFENDFLDSHNYTPILTGFYLKPSGGI